MTLLPGDRDITHLYKYRSINKYTIESLIKNEFFFSFPSNFNDPFDTKLNVIYKGDKTDWENFIRRNGASPEEEKILLDYLESINYDITKLPQYHKNYFSVKENMMILCLSRQNYIEWPYKNT